MRGMSGLRNELSALAATFADSVLAAIRGASIEELLGEAGTPARRAPAPTRARSVGRPARASSAPRAVAPSASAGPVKRSKGDGRLARRTPEDIAQTLGVVVALVKKHPKGLRSEEIRKALKLDVREVPRVLKEGLSKKALKSKGQKRATVYSAA
jgi:hypothetical protein